MEDCRDSKRHGDNHHADDNALTRKCFVASLAHAFKPETEALLLTLSARHSTQKLVLVSIPLPSRDGNRRDELRFRLNSQDRVPLNPKCEVRVPRLDLRR